MSASLVGSEMCIRDRRDTAWTRERCPQAWSKLHTAWIRNVLQLASLRPVSYTHLTLPTICSV
eukprot:13488475-Alexandrium_andersonii.AAC.1